MFILQLLTTGSIVYQLKLNNLDMKETLAQLLLFISALVFHKNSEKLTLKVLH